MADQVIFDIRRVVDNIKGLTDYVHFIHFVKIVINLTLIKDRSFAPS